MVVVPYKCVIPKRFKKVKFTSWNPIVGISFGIIFWTMTSMVVDYYLEIVATLEIALTPHIHRPGKKSHLISGHDFHIISHLRGAQTQCFVKNFH